MPTRDTRVDGYVAKAQPFARPILRYLREVVHEGCPDVVETIKWGMPSFTHHGILAGMAAFKAHVAFGFWKGKLVTGEATRSRDAMWGFGRITALDDLPSRPRLVAMVRKAARLNAAGAATGTTAARPVKQAKPSLRLPADLAAALKAKPKAKAFYATLPPSARRDYIEWIVEAKRPATRAKRLAEAVQWLGEGKRRNWKYER